MIDLIVIGQLNGWQIKPMCSVLVNEWAFYGPCTTLRINIAHSEPISMMNIFTRVVYTFLRMQIFI